jgi:hypothetical protein
MKDAIQSKSSFKEVKKRSSLKFSSNMLDPQKIVNYKRNSVSFNLESVKKFKKLKFDIGEIKPADKKILVEKKKKFDEVRRQSVKNEFNLVRDFLKNKAFNIDDLEDIDEVKENTKKNITMGKEGLKSIESDSEDSVSDSKSSKSEENKSEENKSEENKSEENKSEENKNEEKKSEEKKEELTNKEKELKKKIKEFEDKEKDFEKKVEEFDKKFENLDKK